MKGVWITALDGPEKATAQVQTLLGGLRTYGLDGNGHFWTDDLKNMAWMGPREKLEDKNTALWVILGSKASLEPKSVRYGLSLLTLGMRSTRGYGFPVVVLDTGDGIDPATLPGPLRGAEVLPFSGPPWGAKLAARAGTPVKPLETGYRIDVFAQTSIGVWLEIGPAGETVWEGAMAGVTGGGIDFHAVGPAGRLPEKATLEYPLQGLTLKLGEKDYTAWAVKNRLDGASSYFVRLTGEPEGLVFGPFEAGDDAGMFVVDF